MEQAVGEFLLVYLVIMSLIGFILMGVDKRRAINRAFRISERTLIIQAFLGGGPGTLLAMYVFHHKTKHMKFVVLVPIAALISVAVITKLVGFY